MDSVERTVEDLKNHLPVIKEIIDEAWELYLQTLAGVTPSKLVRAVFMWDRILDGVRNRFEGRKECRIVETGGVFLLSIGCYVLRFQKMDPYLKVRFSTTQLTMDFRSQNLEGRQLCLNFNGYLTSLYVGYVPDTLGGEIEGIYLTCPNGDSIDWAYRIDDLEERIITKSQDAPNTSIKEDGNQRNGNMLIRAKLNKNRNLDGTQGISAK